MEASALARATRGGLLARRSPLLRFEGDERLIALIRAGHDGAFEVLFNRYHSRLLGFCQSMLKSRQDAEDVLQEVFANAHAAMLGDERAINVRPWLYRIARNRCLNHLRKPVPEGQDTMDIHPHQNGTTTAEQVQNREDLRQLLADVRTLPETQRTALLLREIDQLSYEEIAQAMDTTVPAIKSLLVRARIALAESSQARLLTCEEVQVELAEAAEGLGEGLRPGPQARPLLRRAAATSATSSAPTARRSPRSSRSARSPSSRAACSRSSSAAARAGTGGAAAGGGAVGAVGGASAAGGLSGGIGLLGGAIGTKAAAGVATAALLTAGAVEVRNLERRRRSPGRGPRAGRRRERARGLGGARAARAQRLRRGRVRRPRASARPRDRDGTGHRGARGAAGRPRRRSPRRRRSPLRSRAPHRSRRRQGGVVIGTEPGEGAVVPTRDRRRAHRPGPADRPRSTRPGAHAAAGRPARHEPSRRRPSEPTPETEPPAEPAVPPLP